MDCGSTILIFLAFIQATCGQSVTVTGPSTVEQGSDTVYTCTGGAAQSVFIWEDVSEGGLNIFINGVPNTSPSVYPKYVNFDVSENEDTSTMTISNTLIEDEGQYRCGKGPDSEGSTELTVEVKANQSMKVESTFENNIDMYVATCEALEGRPEVTITWMLDDGPSPCDDPVVVTHPDAAEGLSSTRSVCTFQATSENYNQTLKCVINGYQVSGLNENKTITLDMHSAPRNDNLRVTFQFPDTSLRVSCDIVGADQPVPVPLPRNYSIFSDGTQILQSSTGINFVIVPESDFDLETEFYCQASNYLGIATSQTTIPTRTTAPPPTTALETTTLEDTVGSNGSQTAEPSANVAAIAGGVVAAIVIIVIIVIAVCYCKKQERFCFEAGGTPASSNKPSGRAVGSSNGSGSEKEKLPQAAPRGHGSIQHTNDNPDQAMYAMVDKKPARGGGGGAGDAPDRGSAPGQNEPQGMLYADLDLSHKAGHTDKHVPKNENDVVVYSSILV